MKKTSLLLMSVGLVFSAVAQNAVKEKSSKVRIIKAVTLARVQAKIDNVSNKSMGVANHKVRLNHIVSGYSAQSAVITAEVSMGSSYNSFGVSNGDCRPLTANQDLNYISFTHRQNNGATGGSGLVMTSSVSAPNACTAASWDSTMMIYTEQYQGYSGGRYPSGVIMNPSGNTVADSAFVVASGPITNGTSWVGDYFSSSNLAGKHLHNFVIPEPGLLHDSAGITFQYFACVNSQATDDGAVHVLGDRINPQATPATNQNYVSDGVVVNTGILDAVQDTFKWTQTEIHETFGTGAAGQEYGSEGNMAWSQDGTVGYVVFIGQDGTTSYNGTYEPIVFKTTNSGTTWTKMSIFDFSTVANITSHLYPLQTNSSKTVPFFYAGAGNGLGLTVDANYNLHIACQINGVANQTSSPDSAQIYEKQQLFDVYTTSTGWNALWIDSLNGEYVAAANTNWTGSPSSEDLGYGARLQASRTKDGKKVFYEWTDTDPELDTLNYYPNVFAKGFDVTTGLQTAVFNFSGGTNWDSGIYWMFASDLTLEQAGSPNVYTIPTTSSTNSSFTSTSAVQHYYLCSVTFNDNDFVALGVNELAANKVSVSQNFPNPFQRSTSFNVTLSQTSNVTVKVYNTVGQLIMVTNNNNLSVGTHTMSIDGAKLAAGLYFYSVKVGDNNIITHKMIVE